MATSMSGGYGMGKSTGSVKKLGNSGYNQLTTQQFTPQQMQLFQQMFGQVSPESSLSKLAGGDQSQFEAMERPALQQFAGLQGGLASRFAGAGSFGGTKSSGFKNSMNQASQDFAGQLQSQRMGLQRQALQDLMGMSNQLLGQRPYEQFLAPKQKPFWQELLGGLGGVAGRAAGSLGGIYGANKLGLLGNTMSQGQQQ